MRKKSVRDMKIWERQHFSLEAKVFRSAVLGAIILGMVALLIALGLYVMALVQQYINKSFGIAKSTASILRGELDVNSLTKEVVDIYESLSDEELQDTESDDYRRHFSHVIAHLDYQSLKRILNAVYSPREVDDIYVGYYDRERQTLVYICMPDEDDKAGYQIGGWEPVSREEIEKFCNWDGEKPLYHISRTEDNGYLCTSGVPINDAEGNPLSFVLADMTLKDVAHGIRNFLVQYTLALYIVVCLVGFLLSRRMRKMTSTPINEIANAALNYAEDRVKGSSNSEYFSSLQINTGDEVENLALVMADMEKSLTQYEQDLTRVTAEKERISTELSLAARIQADILPNEFPPFPERSEFDIYAVMDPAKEVGGDFYDFFLIDDDHLVMTIADVSGKGIPAALFMMASRIELANHAMQGRPPGEVLRLTNEDICKNNREQMFVTVWIGILEISTGKVTAANGGHEYPVLTNEEGSFELRKDRHSLVVGFMSDISFKEYEFTLRPGDRLFLYTDGVPEAMNAQDELFGTARMVEALNAHADEPIDQILGSVHRTVDDFAGETPQFDDLTMMILEYKGPAA